MLICSLYAIFFFFFQAEDGIRDWSVTGVQTCALPIFKLLPDGPARAPWLKDDEKQFIAARLHAEDSAKERDALRALRDPRVLMLGLAYAGLLFAAYGIQFWLPLIVQGMGFSNTANGFIVACVYGVQLPGMILWGRSSDRRGERVWHVAMGALLGAAGLVVASVAQSTLVALLALAVTGIAVSSVFAPFYGLSSSFLSGPAMA